MSVATIRVDSAIVVIDNVIATVVSLFVFIGALAVATATIDVDVAIADRDVNVSSMLDGCMCFRS